MTQELVKKAFADAEKERQEKEISKIKQIVQSYLEKIQNKAEQKDKLDEEIRLLKKDLDDLKAGRLDRIKERQDKDERAREVSIVIVKEIHEKLIPYYPWRSPWLVEWQYPPQYTYTNGTMYSTSSIIDTAQTMGTGSGTYLTQMNSTAADLMKKAENMSLTITGQTMSNFTGGAYDVKGKIINL